MPTLHFNCRYSDLLIDLVGTFKPEEEFFTSDAVNRGIAVNKGYMLALYRNKLLRRRRVIMGRYMTNRYSIPIDICRKVDEHLKKG